MGNEESKLHKHEHKSKKSQNNTCQYVDKFLQVKFQINFTIIIAIFHKTKFI